MSLKSHRIIRSISVYYQQLVIGFPFPSSSQTVSLAQFLNYSVNRTVIRTSHQYAIKQHLSLTISIQSLNHLNAQQQTSIYIQFCLSALPETHIIVSDRKSNQQITISTCLLLAPCLNSGQLLATIIRSLDIKQLYQALFALRFPILIMNFYNKTHILSSSYEGNHSNSFPTAPKSILHRQNTIISHETRGESSHGIQLIIEQKQSISDMSAPIAKKSVNNYSYHLTDTIGEGFSSQVYKGLDQKFKRSVAIKVVSKLNHNAREQIELAKAEIKALGILKGKNNILELKEALQTKNSMYIITQLCPKGTLRDQLTTHRKLKEEKAIKVVIQIINGYRSIHSEGLIHRDIKPDNLFLTADDQLKIGDFGFAIEAEKCSQALRENLGSPLFMSPQALTRNEYSFKSDIWAIGVTFFEMLVGKVPWRSKTEKELMQQLQNFSIQTILPKGLSEVCQRILRRTLVKDVDLRMGPEQLFRFDFQQQRQNSTTASILKKRASLDVIFQSSLTKIGQKRASRPSIKQNDTCGKNVKKGEESDTTDENSKQNLEKIGEIDAETPIITKMTNSLSLQQTPALPEKGKNKFNRKYSEIQEKDEMLKFSQLEEQLPIMKNKSETVSQTKLTQKMQKQILLQIQSQINYFRFIFKVFKKTNQMLKTSDQHIRRLKHNLLYLSHAKIQEIKILKYLNVSNDIKTSFKVSHQYTNVLDVLDHYSQRYKKQEEKTGISAQCEGEKEFIEKLTYTLKVLHQNILKIQTNIEEFQRKKSLVFIVQDLLELSKLYVIQRQHNWSTFHKQSNIFKTLQKTNTEVDFVSHWEKIKSGLKKLIKI